LLGASAADGGYGDEQAMRVTLLGRRINKICMLDRTRSCPLLPCLAVQAAPGAVSASAGGLEACRSQPTSTAASASVAFSHGICNIQSSRCHRNRSNA